MSLTTAQGQGELPRTGAIPSTPEQIARSPRIVVRAAARGERPASLVLTEYLPPIATQGKQGSCTAWATAYYTYTYSVAQQRKLSADRLKETRFQFSPAFLYNQINGGKDSGSHIADAFKLLREKGCATLDTMPYRETDYTTAPGAEALTRASRYIAEKNGYLFGRAGTADIEALKTYFAEARRPIVVSIPIYEDFPRGKVEPDFVYRHPGPVPPGHSNYHAVTLIGYDDARRAFRMVNSWGDWWGDKGFVWLSEDFIRESANEGWSVVPGGIAARQNVRSTNAALAFRIRWEAPAKP